MTKKRQVGRRKHIPMRMCIACRQSMPKRSLLRIVVMPKEGLVVDPTGKKAGRGAYLCQDPACWDKVSTLGDDSLSRALCRTITEKDKASLTSCIRRTKGESSPIFSG